MLLHLAGQCTAPAYSSLPMQEKSGKCYGTEHTKRQPLPKCEKETLPVTYSNVLAVAGAAAANLLAAQEKNGSAETFSHINTTARADLEESRIL